MRSILAIGLALVLFAISATGLVAVSHASADAVVVVFVRQNGAPAHARVVIRDEQGVEHSCEADANGSCEIEGVGPGRHVVETTGAPGATVTRPVMIPDEGKVTLYVSVP